MEFNLFIVPITAIAVQVLKQYIPSKHVPLVALAIGGIAGLAFGLYYGGDVFGNELVKQSSKGEGK